MKFQDTGAARLPTTRSNGALEQTDELRDGKLLGALGCFLCRGQPLAVVSSQQIVANCIALVAEAETYKVEKSLAIQGGELPIVLGHQSHYRRIHFGRRTKCSRGHGEKQLGRAQKLG